MSTEFQGSGKTSPQSMRLRRRDQHRIGARGSEATKFEVPVSIVSPVMLSNPALTIGDLVNFNESREVSCLRLVRDARAIQCNDRETRPTTLASYAGPARPLTAAELLDRATRGIRANAQIPPDQMLSGYAGARSSRLSDEERGMASIWAR